MRRLEINWRRHFKAASIGLDTASKGALTIAAGSAMVGQIELAAPAALFSTATGLTSAAIDLSLDLSAGGLLEAGESIAPWALGQITSQSLQVMKVPAPVANSVGTGVETIGTTIEFIGDMELDR